MNKQFTLTQWLVAFFVLFFLTISAADAKTKHKRKKKEKQYAVQTYGNISVMVTNITDNTITRSQNIDQVRALASMTKLMTAMVALDYDRDMNRKLVLSKNAGSKMPRREYTRGELFHMLLIKSDNAAAETLAADYPGGRQRFIHHMNSRALMLDMYSTSFDDPSGLSKYNVSTASDVTQMVIESSNYPEIREISIKKVATILTQVKQRNRVLVLHNTNTAILSQVNGVQISKTGYTNPAGFCVAIMVHKTEGDRDYHEVIVVMGARNSSHRVDTVKRVVYNGVIGDYYDTPSRI
jgi:D-alanyl-D-alanine endopeptidase (penicillin-binding protein 7)